MKEDAQLICPIAYDDPNNLWQSISNQIINKLPLRDITIKTNTTLTFTTIQRLPLKFLPSSSNLFKDTDHPFRWFLAPYVNLFICKIDSFEEYKVIKPQIKQWVEFQSGIKRSYWIIVYVPSHSTSADIQIKLFNRLSSDFYVDRSGDRIVIINNQVVTVLKQQQPYNELLSKIRDGIIYSFQNRLTLYDNDIRRLDSYRGTLQLEFRQLFLVKESLALMYQMMQLPNESLMQYEELEALLSFAPLGVLPDPEYPWVLVDNPVIPKPISTNTSNQSTDLSTSPNNTSTTPLSNHTNNESNSQSNNVVSPAFSRELDSWISVCKNGDDILLYSMNISRTKILKNKLSQIEIYKYLFSRQIYLLTQLNKSNTIAEKGYSFILSIRSSIERLINDQMIANSNDSVQLNRLTIRSKQADFWIISASIKIIRACLDSFHKPTDDSNETNRQSKSSNNSNQNDLPWVDISIKTFIYLSDLLRYLEAKLITVIPNAKKAYSHAMFLSESITSYDSFVDDRIWIDSSKRRLSNDLGNENNDNSYNNDKQKLTVEEMLSVISKRLRSLAISLASNNQSSKRKTKSYSIDQTSSLSSSKSKLRSNTLDNESMIISTNPDIQIPILLHTVVYEMDFICNRMRYAIRERIIAADLLVYFNNIPRAIEYYCNAINMLNNLSNQSSNYQSNGLTNNTTTLTMNSTKNSSNSPNSKQISSYTTSLSSNLSNVSNISSTSSNVNINLFSTSNQVNNEVTNNPTNNLTNDSINTIENKLISNPFINEYNDQNITNCIHSCIYLSPSSFSNEWLFIHYTTLKKLLLCIRLVNNRFCYSLLSIQLISSKFNTYNHISKYLIKDIDSYINQRTDTNNQLVCNSNIDSYFNIIVNYTSTYLKKKLDKYNLFDADIPVVLIECSAEYIEKAYVDINIDSKLKDSIVITKIIISYRLFNSHASDLLELISDRIISIQPGKQSIQLPFQSTRIGDYILNQIILQLSDSMKFIHNYPTISFDNYITPDKYVDILRISIPISLQSTICRIYTSSYLPSSQLDYIVVYINTNNFEVIRNLMIELIVNDDLIDITNSERWIITNDLWNQSSIDNNMKYINEYILSIEYIPNQSELYIKIPITMKTLTNMSIQTKLSYDLTKSQCIIPINDYIESNVINCGNFFNIQLTSYPCNKLDSFYSLYTIRNQSSLDININSIRLNDAMIDSWKIICEDVNDSKSISIKSNSIYYLTIQFIPNEQSKSLPNLQTNKFLMYYKRSIDSSITNESINKFYQSIEFIEYVDIYNPIDLNDYSIDIYIDKIISSNDNHLDNRIDNYLVVSIYSLLTISYSVYLTINTTSPSNINLSIKSLGSSAILPVGLTNINTTINLSDHSANSPIIQSFEFTYLTIESSISSMTPIEIEYKAIDNQSYQNTVYPNSSINGFIITSNSTNDVSSQTVYFIS